MSKRVIITGACGGIGAATAARLRDAGSRVLGLDLTETEDVIACDVRDQGAVDGAVAQARERLGGIDVLINCAGIGTPQSAGERPGEAAEAVIDINLMGPWRVTAAAIEDLLAARGRVVNVSSGLAFLTAPFATAYTMSKRGLVAYSDALRLEYANSLEVTTFYPGYVRTAIHEASTKFGVTLEGMVPPEPLEQCASALADAAIGRYRRDVATTPRAAVSYVTLKTLPRHLVDSVARTYLTRQARRGRFSGNPAGHSFSQRLTS